MANTLEEILQTYFGCKVPFRKDGELTTTGIKAYKRLEDLLGDLESIGVIPSASQAVSVLDDITHEGGEMPDDGTPKELRKGIKYVLDNIDEDDLAMLKAEMNRCWKMHVVPTESTVDCDVVIDLLEEYGEENDLGERWWEQYCEMDDIICKL